MFLVLDDFIWSTLFMQVSNRGGVEPTRFDQGFQRIKRRISPLYPLEALIRLEGLDVPLNEN